MDELQKNYINKNLPALVDITTFNTTCAAVLVANGVFGKDDLARLAAFHNERDKVFWFYQLVMEKADSYTHLVTALKDSCQRGALKILSRLDTGVDFSDVTETPGTSSPISTVKNVTGILINMPISGSTIEELKQQAGIPCNVNFQDVALPLHRIIVDLDHGIQQKLAKNFLENPNFDISIQNSVPKNLEYYISRRLTKRCRLNTSLFNKWCPDVFVVRGIQLNELSQFANSDGTDLSTNQMGTLSVRFIVLVYEKDFEKICKIASSSVHLLHHELGEFTWVKTHGDLTGLQGFIHNIQEHVHENTLVCHFLESKHSSPICISDTPGMGKSVLLANVAHSIAQANPARFISFIVLREFIHRIKSEKEAAETQVLINLIGESASESEYGREIVRHLMSHQRQVVDIMCDGFDEVLASQLNIAKIALKTISRLLSVRLFVTTRPHMRDELENSLGVLGYNILAFEEKEQICCLTRYWQQQRETLEESKLVEFAVKCLQKLKTTMNDFERDIAGIPLQCSLLAEVYQDEAVNYAQPESNVANLDLGILIRITSIFEMYQKLMDIKFARAAATCSQNFWKFLRKRTTKRKVKYLMKAHIYAALQLIFPEHAVILKPNLVGNNIIDPNELCSVGVLEKTKTDESMPRFVHRTFAEYFLGLFIAQTFTARATHSFQIFISQQLHDFINTVLHTYTFSEHLLTRANIGKHDAICTAKFQYPVICYFINAHLKDMAGFTYRKLFRLSHQEMLGDIIHACVIQDYAALYACFLASDTHRKFLQRNSDRFQHLLILSAKYSSFELVKLIYQHCLEFKSLKSQRIVCSSPLFMITPLHVAVGRGHFAIAEFFLKAMNETEALQMKFVLHFCVTGTQNEQKFALSQKAEIIPLLARHHPSWLNEPLPDGTTPLLTCNVHVNLLKCLVLCGADLQSKNLENDGVLHIHTKQENPNNSLYLLGLPAIEPQIRATNNNELTPFLESMKFGRGLSLEIIKMMEDKGMFFTTHLASDALSYLLCNMKLRITELRSDFTQVVDFLIQKKAVAKCKDGQNPWNTLGAERNFKKISEVTVMNSMLLQELIQRQLISANEMETYLGKPTKLLEELKTSKPKNAFENLCASLVACNQIQPFIHLRQCISWDIQNAFKFLSPPAGLLEFIHSSDENVAVLRSYDLELSFERIKNTIDPNIPLIISADRISYQETICIKFELISNTTVKQLAAFPGKTICLCQNVSGKLDNCVILYDESGWEDLSTIFQEELRTHLKIAIKNQETYKWENYLLTELFEFEIFSLLKNEILAALIQGRTPKLINYTLVHVSENKRYLMPMLFFSSLSDKLTFQGITVNELKKISKHGRKIGGIDDDVENLEYIVVKNEQQFLDICKRITGTVHFINYLRFQEEFQLVKTKGSDSEIKQFVLGKECETFAVHFEFEYNFSVSVGSQNLPSKLVKSLKLDGCVELIDLISFLEKSVSSNSSMSDMLTQLRSLVVTELSKSHDDEVNEILVKWFQNQPLKCNEREFTLLKEIAVNTFYPYLFKEIDSTEVQKFIDTGLLKETTDCFIFAHKAIAWYIITKLVFKGETSNLMLNMNEISSIDFRNCFKPTSIQLTARVQLFKTLNADKICTVTFKSQKNIQFIDCLLEKHFNTNNLRLLFCKNIAMTDFESWIYACVYANYLHLFKLLVKFEWYPAVFDSENLILLALTNADTPIIHLVSQMYHERTGKSVKDIRINFKGHSNTTFEASILHVAALRGSHSVMEYILKDPELKSLVNYNSPEIITFCVNDTANLSQSQIYPRKRLISSIIQSNHSLYSEIKQDPLVVVDIHKTLAHCLCSYGLKFNTN